MKTMHSFWKRIFVKGANFMKTDRTVNWAAVAAILFGAVTIVAMRAMKSTPNGRLTT